MRPETQAFIAPDRHEVRPLRHWKTGEAEALRAAVVEQLAAWSADWRVLMEQEPGLDDAPGAAVSLVDDWSLEEFAALRWQGWQGEEGGTVWWSEARAAGLPGARVSPQQAVLDAMYGSTGRATMAGGAISQQMAREAWHGWCQRLATCFGIELPTQGDAPGELGLPAGVIRPWSGALALRVSCAGMLMLLVPDGQSVQRWADTQGRASPLILNGSRPALVPVAEAVAPCTARLSVELAPIDIGLGILASLRNGDVLRTTHRLDTPLRVLGHADRTKHAGALLCEAFLGQQGDVRVVELLGTTLGQRAD